MKTVLNTKRLKIRPLSDDEILELYGNTTEPALKAAYGEMLEGCKENPEKRIWYAPWVMELRKGKIQIGELGFRGKPKNDTVEIGYGVKKEYEGQGFTTEAAKALMDWAFTQKGVFFVEAEAEESNKASLRVIEKLGFVRYGIGEEGPRFVKAKPPTNYISICLCLGLCFSSALKSIFNSYAIGMSVGLAVGVAVGAYLDNKAKKDMQNAMERREQRLGG